MFGFEFANPKYFWLLVLLIPVILWYVFKEKQSHADLQFSSLRAFRGIRHAGRVWLRHLLFACKVLAIVFLIIALARPQSSNSWQTYSSEGIDIVLGLDISTRCWPGILRPTVWRRPKKWPLNLFWNVPRTGLVWSYLPEKALRNVP